MKIGNNMNSTVRLNDNPESSTNGQITQVNPSSNVVIRSLVNQICSILEKDKKRRDKLYNGNQSYNFFSDIHKNICNKNY